MPERSFGRTVRYRRTKLGLSQAKLGELVGRSTATIKSWERDRSRPNDPNVVSALAAILAVDERQLFERAGVDRPAVETSPTVEQALATLSFDSGEPQVDGLASVAASSEVEPRPPPEPFPDPQPVPEPFPEPEPDPEPEPFPDPEPKPVPVSPDESDDDQVDEPDHQRELVRAGSGGPAYVAPPDPYIQTPLTPTLTDVSYMEDRSQRQLYRVRTLATLVAVVALLIAFVWAIGEGLGALGDWWDEFFGNLRL